MKRRWQLIVLIVILFVVSQPSGDAAQEKGRPAAGSRKARTLKLGSVPEFKEAFQNDKGNVRLVTLISPT